MRVFASCDSAYFHEHAHAWYSSALKCLYTPIIEVVNPDEEVKRVVEENKWNHVYYVEVDNPSKSYLCSNRFHSAEKYLTEDGLLITDIDCYFNHNMPAPEADVGLFFRPGNPDHMKIAAGIVWYSGSDISKEFAQAVSHNITKLKDQWFVDQLGILYTFAQFQTLANQNSIKFYAFTQKHMDWEFQEGTYMWTGKGPRKHFNSTYVRRKKEIEQGVV